MRLAILSDVHGNLPALEAVLSALQSVELDGILVAGDLVNGGPHPVETLHRLKALDCWMVLGNADRALLRYDAGESPANQHPNHQFNYLRWTYRRLDRETLETLRSLPEQRTVALPGAPAIRLVHGSPRHIAEELFPDRNPEALDASLAQISEPALVCGHTHIPWQLQRRDRYVLNPGAVSGPLNGEVGAQYALLDWRGDRWQASHFTLAYDLEQMRRACQESGLLDEAGPMARAYLLCLETGRDVFEDFSTHVSRLAAEAGCPDSDLVPDETWERAAATFDWEQYKGQ